MILGGLGRFGPYLKVGADFISCLRTKIYWKSALTVRLKLLKLEKKRLKTNQSQLVCPTLDTEITVQSGRYGPYAKCGKTNAPFQKM